MTTLLPPPELAMLRTIKKAAIELFVCLIIDHYHPGQAIAVYQVADILEIDQRTVQKHLRSLSAAGIMLEQRPFWYVVTPAGRNTLFGWNPQQASLSIEEIGECSQIVHVAHNVCKSIDEDDDEVKLNLKDSSSSSINYAQNVQILDATHLLFGGGSITTAKLNLNFFEPEWILSWVAKAYADQATPQKPRGLTNPQGFIYRQLQKCELPSATVLAQYPLSALPEEYLDAIGRYERTCDRCDEKFTKLSEFKMHWEKCIIPHPQEQEEQEVIALVADDTIVESVEHAWISVLGQLQAEMSKAAFNTWVWDTKAIHLEDGELSIGARNAYARDWLESRLTSTVQRMLAGIMNCEVSVRFVVAAETE